MDKEKLDNLDIVLRAVNEFFMRAPTGVLRKRDMPSLTGIKAAIAHPVMQLLCGGPSSPYESGPRAEALRGILDRHSHPNNTTYTLSNKGQQFFGIDNLALNQEPLALLDTENVADLLLAFVGKKFTSVDFVQQFESERPIDFAALVARYGAGGSGSGLQYSIRSYLANSLSRYARKWSPSSGFPHLLLEGIVKAPNGQGTETIGLWWCEPDNGNLVADIAAIFEEPASDNTEREQMLKARIGQGRFRQLLVAQWQCTCPVTKCNDARVLVASHIKRWCDSDNRERLDPFNGLLLSPDVDRLFDKHLISFEDSGRMLLSKRITSLLLTQLGLSSDVSIELDPRHMQYLAAHRDRMAMLDTEMEDSQRSEE